jgi:hypothetical protein
VAQFTTMHGPGLEMEPIQRNDQFSKGIGRVSLSPVLAHLQRAIINFDLFGLTNGTLMKLDLLISIFHQPKQNNIHRRYDHMKTTMPMRVRISRFLEERYVHRAQPHFFPELALFGLTVIIAVWPMISLASAMETVR